MDSDASETIASLAPEFPNEWSQKRLVDNGVFGQVFIVQEEENPDEEKFIGKEVQLKDAKIDKAKNYVELDIMMKIKHPRIVNFYGYVQNTTHLTLFFEYLSKGSIKDLLETHGALAEDKIRSFTRQILEALEYLHEKNPPIIHRNIQGMNILMKDENNIKVTDFGLSKIVHSATQARTVAGTYNWMAPEVVSARNTIPYDFKADIWSLGCTVVEMATKYPPYKDFSTVQVVQALTFSREPVYTLPESSSQEMKNFLQQTFQMKPTDRPKASELKNHEFTKLT